jgi:hypothetical protein
MMELCLVYAISMPGDFHAFLLLSTWVQTPNKNSTFGRACDDVWSEVRDAAYSGMKASITDLDITLQPSHSLTKFFTIWVFGIPNHTFSAGTNSHKIITIWREFTPGNCTFITKLSGQVHIFGIMLHSIVKNFLYFDFTHFIILFLLFLYSLLRILQRHLGNSKPSSIQRIIFHH